MELQEELTERREKAIDASFDTVIKGIEFPQEVINTLRKAVKDHIGYRQSEKIFKETLSTFDWSWPEFDKWKVIFEKLGKWPYMWVKNKAAYEKLKPRPDSIEDALKLVRVTELKMLAKKYNINISSPKRSEHIKRAKIRKRVEGRKKTKDGERSQLVKKIVEASISLEQIISSCEERFQEMYAKQRIARRKGMAVILHHTIIMKAHSLGNASEKELFSREFSSDVKYEALGDGCEVEEMYASLYNQGKLKGYPPFFPGDRTCLIPVIDIP